MSGGWDEQAHVRYQRQLHALEEEQDRIRREDQRRIEHNEQVAYALDRKVDELHRNINGVLSKVEGCEVGAAHQVVEQAVEPGRARLREQVRCAVELSETNRRQLRQRAEMLETQYRQQQR